MVISGATIAAALLLAHVLARVITDPGMRTLGQWVFALAMLAALWSVRVVAHWLQARLAQRGATAVIADLSGQVLRSITNLPPRQLSEQRDDAAAVVTRGLDGLRPYFTSYLPALVLAAVLTPATLAVIAVFDVISAGIVMITLPLIPLFMVLIGLVTAARSQAALAAMTTLQARLLDLVAGIPTLRALGRAGGSVQRIAELAAAHRRSTMATLRIAFLSALVLELLATLGVALVAVGVGLRLVYGEMTLSAGLTALLLAPEVFWPLRRVGAEFHGAQDRKNRCRQGIRADRSARDPQFGDPDGGCARRRDTPRPDHRRRTRRCPPRLAQCGGRPWRSDCTDGSQRGRQEHRTPSDPRADAADVGECHG